MFRGNSSQCWQTRVGGQSRSVTPARLSEEPVLSPRARCQGQDQPLHSETRRRFAGQGLCPLRQAGRVRPRRVVGCLRVRHRK